METQWGGVAARQLPHAVQEAAGNATSSLDRQLPSTELVLPDSENEHLHRGEYATDETCACCEEPKEEQKRTRCGDVSPWHPPDLRLAVERQRPDETTDCIAGAGLAIACSCRLKILGAVMGERL